MSVSVSVFLSVCVSGGHWDGVIGRRWHGPRPPINTLGKPLVRMTVEIIVFVVTTMLELLHVIDGMHCMCVSV